MRWFTRWAFIIPVLSISGLAGVLVSCGSVYAAIEDASAVQTDHTSGHPIGRFDVTKFGAKGDGVSDDTAAIQAAFDACWNFGKPSADHEKYGGVVELPAVRAYLISSTIYTYDGCALEGGSSGQRPTEILWDGRAAGVVLRPGGLTIAANAKPYYPAYSPRPPEVPGFTVTFVVANAVAIDQWVLIAGFTSAAGVSIDHTVAQVVEASAESFTVVVPFRPAAIGTFADHGTVTTVNVMFASNAHARYFEAIRDVSFENKRGIPHENRAGVDFYFGSRVDTGSRVWSAWAESPLYYGFYFSQGGIDVDFDKGWRADDPGVAGIYWRVTGSGDNLGIANGTVSTNAGAGVVLDNSACKQDNNIYFSARNMRMEIELNGLSQGMGAFMFLDCPSIVFPVQFAVDLENVGVAASRGSVNYTGIVMSPPNDLAVTLNVVNGIFPDGAARGQTARWVGIPALSRMDGTGARGDIPSLVYAPSLASNRHINDTIDSARAMSQCIGDCNIGQLWQYGVRASAILYTDSSFSALPAGTTLFAGQLIASPESWRKADAAGLAISVIRTTGTTGSPNRGATRCRALAGVAQSLSCNSAVDLSVGQHIDIGSVQDATIARVDATTPDAVVVATDRNVGAVRSAVALSYSAPVAGPAMQLRSEADVRAAGSGSDLGAPRVVHAFCTGIAAPSATLAMSGAGATVATCTAAVGRDDHAQLLMNSDGIVRDLAVRCAHSGVNAKSGSFRIWDLPSGVAMTNSSSGRDTGIGLVYGMMAPDVTVYDRTHSFAYAKGDLLRLQFTSEADETIGDCEASFSY